MHAWVTYRAAYGDVVTSAASACAACRHPATPQYSDNIYDSRLMAPTDTEKALYGYYAGREADSVRSRAGALSAMQSPGGVEGGVLQKVGSLRTGTAGRAAGGPGGGGGAPLWRVDRVGVSVVL